MTFEEYQRAAMTTRTYGDDVAKDYTIPALAAEVGEVCGKWAKHIRDNTDFAQMRKALSLELGDVIWQVAAVCDAFGFRMQDVAQANLNKLTDRAARGVISGSGDNR